MLQISPTELVLNGFRYELTPKQSEEIQSQLKGMAIPRFPWGFSHWTEAAACAHLLKEGYILISPYQQEEESRAKTRSEPTTERQATSPPRKRNLARKLREMTEHRDDLAMELQDFKTSAEGKDVEAAAAIKRERDMLKAQGNTLKSQVHKLEKQVEDLRQRVLVLKDPANEVRV